VASLRVSPALLAPCRAGSNAAAFSEVGEIATVLLRFVAFYSIFDMANVIFLLGQGPGTHLSMKTSAMLA
jgi:hypothetical protein